MMRASRNRDSGVVLVELLAALSILAIMAALTAGILGQLRIVARLAAEAEVRSGLAAAADHLSLTIASARAIPLPGAESVRPPVLVGTPDGLRLVAVTRRGFGTLGLSDVTIASQGARGDVSLVETLRPARPAGASVVASAIIADDLEAARFGYVDAVGSVQPTWSSDTLPAGVRIELGRLLGTRTIRVEVFAPTR